MTKDEAIVWALTSLTEALEYEYYSDEAEAGKAAEAMTLLSGYEWTVLKDEHRFYVSVL